jgi:hypothetical protein
MSASGVDDVLSVSIGSGTGTSPAVPACPLGTSFGSAGVESAVAAGFGGGGLGFVITGLQNLPKQNQIHLNQLWLYKLCDNGRQTFIILTIIHHNTKKLSNPVLAFILKILSYSQCKSTNFCSSLNNSHLDEETLYTYQETRSSS